MKRWILAGVLSLNLASVAQAAIEAHSFRDEAERDRYAELTRELRCPKCQNQDIADSNAPIAADLRKEIYRLLEEGRSNREIVDYMVDRYGEFVRYKPAFSARNALLWFGPGALLVLGGVVIAVIVRRKRGQTGGTAQTLSDEERKRLADLLDNNSLDKHRQ